RRSDSERRDRRRWSECESDPTATPLDRAALLRAAEGIMNDMQDSLPTLLQPDDMADAVGVARQLLSELDRILLGHSDVHGLVMVAILSRGHVLLEGVPGVGKTALVKALAQLLGIEFKRVQFTPDLMPGDILGAHILQDGPSGREMTFRPGPIFTNILLA